MSYGKRFTEADQDLPLPVNVQVKFTEPPVVVNDPDSRPWAGS